MVVVTYFCLFVCWDVQLCKMDNWKMFGEVQHASTEKSLMFHHFDDKIR